MKTLYRITDPTGLPRGAFWAVDETHLWQNRVRRKILDIHGKIIAVGTKKAFRTPKEGLDKIGDFSVMEQIFNAIQSQSDTLSKQSS